ncbi:unnamed protein product [Musa acuminata subsp. burmannicoides]
MGEAATVNGVRKATPPEEEHPRKAFGWAARDASGRFSPFVFSRRKGNHWNSVPWLPRDVPILPTTQTNMGAGDRQRMSEVPIRAPDDPLP